MLGVVGRTGSGKTTLTRLLPRFYDPQVGSVEIDGHNVRDLSFDWLRRQIGVVFEDAFLFSDTIRANIAFGRPEATEAEIVAAARGSPHPFNFA